MKERKLTHSLVIVLIRGDTSIRSMDSVSFQLKSSDFTVSVGIANFKFQALLDTGAAVTAVSARSWREYLIDIHPNLNSPARGAVTTVDGRELVTLGTLVLTFEIGADSFPVKAHVIEGLAVDVIIGRDFLKEFCFGIDFMNNVVEFVHADDPLTFDFGDLDDDPDVDDSEFVSSVHADCSFTIPPRPEKIVLGKLKTTPVNGDDCGIVIPRSDLPHRYSIFGAAEIVNVSENGAIPIRVVNPSAQPVKVFRVTRLGDFSSVGDEVETFELNEFPQEVLSAMSEGQMKNQLPHHDYSDLPDLSDSVLNDDDRIKFRDLFRCYRDVFAFADEQLGKTSLVQHVIDTGDAMPIIKQRPYRTSPRCKQEIDRQVDDMLQKGIIRESVSPWSSPVVLVKNRNGSFRFCVDLRKVNAVTRKDSFPMPLVSDTLDV